MFGVIKINIKNGIKHCELLMTVVDLVVLFRTFSLLFYKIIKGFALLRKDLCR